MSKWWARNFAKFYFTIVSIASIIGMVIAYWIALYNIIINAVITDDEYMLWHSYYEVQNCTDPYSYPKYGRWYPVEFAVDWPADIWSGVQLTQEEIQECEEKATERALSQRSLQKKEAVTWGLIRWVLFTILFITHYPRMQQSEWEVVVAAKKTPTRKRKPTTKK